MMYLTGRKQLLKIMVTLGFMMGLGGYIPIVQAEADPAVAAAPASEKEESGETDYQAEHRALARQLADNPTLLPQLLAQMRVEADSQKLYLLAQVVAGNKQSMQDPSVIDTADELLDAASPAQRQAALILLFHAPEVPEALRHRVALLAREDLDRQVKIGAISVLSRWLRTMPDDAERISENLMEIIGVSQDNTVRGIAIQILALQPQPALPESTRMTLWASLIDDPDPQNRGLVTLGLGAATEEWRDFAIEQMEQAYERETVLDIRRNLITQIVRAGKADAIPVLLRLPVTADAELAQDVEDYLALLDEGIADPHELWRRKSQIDAQRGTLVGAGDAN